MFCGSARKVVVDVIYWYATYCDGIVGQVKAVLILIFHRQQGEQYDFQPIPYTRSTDCHDDCVVYRAVYVVISECRAAVNREGILDGSGVAWVD